MNINPNSPMPADRKRRWGRVAVSLLVFLLGILIGWLFAPRCRPCPCSAGDSHVSGDRISGTGSGPRSRISIGQGSGRSGGGSSEANGDTQGHGYTGDAQGAAGSVTAGGGKGDGQGGSGRLQGGKEASDPLRTAVLKAANGLDAATDEPPADARATPTGKVFTAPDFTYDRTSLPRYPNTLQVQSALAYPSPDNPQKWNSSVGITTTDSFDAVVAWYRQQLPAGWQSEALGDMQQVAQQLSIENITAMLGGASSSAADQNSGAGNAASATQPPAATDEQQRVQIALFKPPSGSDGQPGVMVTRRGDRPVTVMLGARSP